MANEYQIPARRLVVGKNLFAHTHDINYRIPIALYHLVIYSFGTVEENGG